ncbi:MAG TPA: phospholipase D-like domain-containing protein, partial [Flavobacterium sp.]|nr:phospholipase D-like domain-containing protein [Flavobacterium sp.]
RAEELRAAGGWLIFFRPLRLSNILRYHKRNHRRAIIIDGKVAYTGGAAVSDKWQGKGSKPDEWHDTMVRFTGRAALSIQSSFTQLWFGAEGEILIGSRFYPAIEKPEKESDEIAYHLCLNSSPSSGDHPLRKFFWFSFSAAREKLYITNSYFAPDRHIIYAIKNRAINGVDVRLLVPSDHTDAPLVRWTGQSYYQELLSAGVRVYEYQPSMLHSKHVVVDDLWSIVGSANIDIRSKELNEENVVGVLDSRFAGEIEKLFLEDLDKSREITLSAWQRRPWWWRVRERVASLLAEQL